jgi:polysaccharide biosynthesis/export protein
MTTFGLRFGRCIAVATTCRSALCILLALLLGPVAAAAAVPGEPHPFGPKTIRLGSGDVVRVVVFQNTDLTLEARVDGEGRLTYPFLGAIDVVGKTTADVEKMISSGLIEQNVLKRAQVSVSLLQLRSQQIAILGYVNRPGNYPLDMNYSVSGALALAGGVLPTGAEKISLSRYMGNAVQTTELDLTRLFKGGAGKRGDVQLEPGDVLFVPKASILYVYGEVQRPGVMRLESEMTVQQALAASGGLNPRGSMRGLRITRQTTDGLQELTDVSMQTPLLPDDVVFVQQSIF